MEQGDFRTCTISFYNLLRDNGKCVDQVTGLTVSGAQVMAGHIYPHSKCSNLSKFGLAMEFSMNARNGLLMLKGLFCFCFGVEIVLQTRSRSRADVEKAFGKGQVTLIYNSLASTFMWVVLDKNLMTQPLVSFIQSSKI